MKRYFPKNAEDASALILTLLVIVLLSTIVTSFLSSTRTEQTATRNYTSKTQAEMFATRATQEAMAKIQQGFTVNGTATTVITTQPGAIWQYTFAGGSCNAVTGKNPVALFSTNGTTTVNLNNLQNPGNSTSSASSNQWTITGIASERINVVMENVTTAGSSQPIGRIAYYVDDEGTKLNVNAATGNRSTLNVGTRPQDIAALVSSAAGNFSNIINSSSSNTSSVRGWSHFFRPEQVSAAVSGISGNNTPFLSTATTSASSTANMTHLLTPWGTQRIAINTLSTNATNGAGDASVTTIHSALTNSTLTAIFSGNFSDKYTSTGVKQIAANLLQMRDPNTSNVTNSFNYKGPLLGSSSLNSSSSIPQEYLGFAPYPVVSEVSMDVTYSNPPPYFRPYVRVNVELYNPYPVAFNNANATLEFCMRGLTWNMAHTINSTGQSFGPYRYGGYGNWTDNSSSKEHWSQSGKRDSAKNNTQFAEAFFSTHTPYGIQGLTIPAYSKVKYNLTGPFWGTYGQALTNSIFPFDQNDIKITSMTDVRCAITYIKIVGNSTIQNGLGGATNINPNTVRDWVLGADVGPFIPNDGNLSLNSNSNISFPRNAGTHETFWTADPISKYSYQRLCPLIKTSMAASSNLTASTRAWTANASTTNQTFGTVTSATGVTTANQAELLNDANANPNYDSGNTIPSDPSFNNYNGNAIYANATLSNDMRVPELPTGNYSCPADLGLVPTNQRWRRLRMQMQPASEGTLIPDWALLDVITFGNSTNASNPLSRLSPVNLNGRFYLPGNASITPRTVGLSALAKVLENSTAGTIQDPMNPVSSASVNATKFWGNTVNATTIASAISNMTWSVNSTWGKGNSTNDPSSRRKTNKFPVNQYILPSEIMEIAGVADAVSQGNYNNTASHFKWNEGRASALIPAVTTRSSLFTIYAYAQALDKSLNVDSEALTKTLVEVESDTSTTPTTYKVKKIYTQPILIGD